MAGSGHSLVRSLNDSLTSRQCGLCARVVSAVEPIASLEIIIIIAEVVPLVIT